MNKILAFVTVFVTMKNDKPMVPDTHDRTAKYLVIYQDLKRALDRGELQNGDQLPTEMQLAHRYGVSRPTVTKALNALKLQGLIDRRAGSGSYVSSSSHEHVHNRLFGLLVPGLGHGEIFEPICARIASLAHPNNYSLLWSGSDSVAAALHSNLELTARRYIDNGAAGVFFAPIELDANRDEINQRVIEILEAARIPVVLIDTDYVPFPGRSTHDLIGIDNFRSGYIVTEHLIAHGCNRVDFLMRAYSAHTVAIRRRGYQAALLDHGILPRKDWVHVGESTLPQFVSEALLDAGARDFVCANDETAAGLLQTLENLCVSVPDEARVVGFDDVRYSQHLRVPLTTLRQPCVQIGTLAVDTMLWRLNNPGSAPRTVSVAGDLIIRKSCGVHGE